MDIKDKSKILAGELLLIASPSIREVATWMVEQLPDYFFTVAASSSGKYHPPYALGEGGLVRHTQAAARLANTLLLTETFGDQFTRGAKDAIILALILHDGLKHGDPKQRWTVKDHPLLIRPYFENLIAESTATTGIEFGLTEIQRNAVYGLIESHMGQWNDTGEQKMPKPKTEAQKFVHLCDYLASRKSLDFNFNV